MACVRDNKAGGLLGKKVSPRLMPPSEGGYKYFKIKDLFDVSSSKSVDKSGLKITTLRDESYPFVGRTQINNGIQAYTKHLEFEPNPAKTFSVIQVGESVMQYRESPWYASQNIFLLIPYDKRLCNCFLYIISATNKALMKFNGGYNDYPTISTLKELEIYLPIDSQGNIDFSYIEERVRELEEERVRELEAYLQAAGFSDCSLTLAEREALNKFMGGVVRNKSFEIPSIFHIANTHNILKSDVVFNSGTIPYVTASANNNSVVSYISYKNELIERGNSIMIGGKTLVITYQPMDFFSNDSHNLVLRIKDKGGQSESCALFAVTALYKSLLPKYSWGDSISKQKIQNDKVYLPVTDNGSIDYSFMETYISAVKKQVIGRLKDFIAHEKNVYLHAIS